MARTKLILPTDLTFSTTIPVRITDVNYGGHVGNDTILSILHEARMQFLAHHGFSEMNFGGVGMIMSDVSIEFKNELFYGDIVLAAVGFANMSKVSLEIFYKLERQSSEKNTAIAFAKTTMVCFDYNRKKVCAVPESARLRMGIRN